MVFSRLVEPTQVHKTVKAVGIAPGINWEPGKLFCRLPEIKTPFGSGETSDPVDNTCRIFKNMRMLPTNFYPLINRGNDMITTSAEDKILFFLFFPSFLFQLLGNIFQLFVAVLPQGP